MNKLMEQISGRTLAVVLALLLAAVATVVLADYVQGEREAALKDAELVQIYYANRDVEAGVSVTAAINANVFELRPVPADTVPGDAVTDLSELTDLVSTTFLYAGQPILLRQFAAVAPDSTAFEVPEGFVAVSIDIDATAGVANFVDPGDRVTIVAHTSGSGSGEGDGAAAGSPTTRLLLQNVQILAIGRRVTAGVDAGDQVVNRNDEALTVTFAVTPRDAEKLVYGQIEAQLYLLLLPEDVDDFDPANTPGRNADNLFGS